MFEQKIDTVFNDTKDCCYNSKQFSEKVMKAFKIDRGVFIQSTVFNYHTVGWDREVGPKQSYESRLRNTECIYWRSITMMINKQKAKSIKAW